MNETKGVFLIKGDWRLSENRILQAANEGVVSRGGSLAARINNTDAAHGSAAAFGARVTPTGEFLLN